MMQPVEKLATERALTQLMEFSLSGSYSQMDLKRIEREVIALLDVGKAVPAQGQMIFGIIGFLAGDRAKAESGFHSALKLAPNNAVIYLNAITGLSSLGNFRESIDLIRVVLERYPDNKLVLAKTMVQAEQALQLNLARSIIEKYDKLSANGDTRDISIFRNTMNRSLTAYDSLGFSDDELLKRLEVAVGAIRADGVEPRRTSTFTLRDGTVIYNMYLPLDSMACAEMNFKIADALFESFEETGVEYFSIICRPYSDFPEIKERGNAHVR